MQQHPGVIGPPQCTALRAALAPISESYLRRLLRDSSATLHPLVEGTRQENLHELSAPCSLYWERNAAPPALLSLKRSNTPDGR